MLDSDSAPAPARIPVLVADDDPGLLKILELSFRAGGYDVATAPDGAVARAAVEARRFELLVLDILMPGATGWEVLDAAIAATPPGEPLPRAILITGFHQEYVVDFSLLRREGVGAMVLKPFAPADLLAEAARVLEGPPKVARARDGERTPVR